MYMLHENYPRGREKKKEKKARGKSDDKLAYVWEFECDQHIDM